MGNKQTEKFEWDKKFVILEKNFNDNTVVLQKFQGGNQYIGRQIISTDKRQSEEIKRLIQLKYNKNNPFLTKLMQIYYNSDESYCSAQDKIFLVFQKPKQTLRQQILARKFANQPFTEQQADIILQSGCKAIRSLKQLKHPHNNVSTSSVFIDEDRKIVLGDPWITPPIYSQDINQNVFACPSPQKILLQNDQIMSICPYRSDLFSLGTVVLEVLNFQHMDILYEKGFRRLIQSKVQEKLSKIKNQQLRYKLSTVLSHDPNNRDQIFKFYRTAGLSVSNVRNKVVNGNMYYPQKPKNQFNKAVEKPPVLQINRQKQTHHQIQPRTRINPVQQPMPKPKINSTTNNNLNMNIGSVPYYPAITKTNNQQTNYSNNMSNIPSNALTYNPPSITQNYKLSNTLTQANSRAQTFPNNPTNNINNNINRPYYQASTYNLGIKTPTSYQNGTNGLANYMPGSINGTFTSNLPYNFNSSTYNTNNNVGNFLKNYTPQFKGGNVAADEKSSTLPLTFNNIKIQNKEVISQPNVPAFEPTNIKNSQQFVKTSGNIRYVQNLSKSEDSILKEQVQNIQHVGNYGVKGDLLVTKPTLPSSQNFQVKVSKQPTNQPNTKRKTTTNNTNKTEIKTQQKSSTSVNKPPINQIKQTPQRRPNRKYNSTIKEEPEQCSYSGSRDGDDEYQCVLQEYETGKYEGQKKNGMRNGFGKFIYNEGSVYEGNWKDNLMHGKGNLYYSDGKLAYEGDWRMDQFHGFGKVYNQDQLPIKGSYDYTDFSNVNDYWASYEGQLNSDRRHGKGKIKFSNGQIFSGNFVADVVQGEGKFYTLSGQIIHGIWKNNKLSKKF